MRVVQKFGGTSVADLKRIRTVAQIVKSEVDKGHEVAVVVSAMAGVTDQLVKWTDDISSEKSRKCLEESDVVLASGEQVTTGLLTLALKDLGVEAQSFMGWQLPILTDTCHGHARIVDIQTDSITACFAQKKVAVIAGFQGMTSDRRITTVGRGGTDTTAVALAAELGACRCDIYTDVDGVYTADPRIVPVARKLNQITYEEMLELASQGAKVLQTRAVEVAMRHRVPVRVLSSFNDNPGTLVTSEDQIMEREFVSGVTCNRDEAKMTVRGLKNHVTDTARIIGPLADATIHVDMIIKNVPGKGQASDLTFTVPKGQKAKAVMILEEIKEQLGYSELTADDHVAKVSVVGVGMRTHVGVARIMFDALAGKNIDIQVISTSEIKISVLIDADYADLAVQTLHAAYKLEQAAPISCTQ